MDIWGTVNSPAYALQCWALPGGILTGKARSGSSALSLENTSSSIPVPHSLGLNPIFKVHIPAR